MVDLAQIISPVNIRMSILVGQNERTDELNARITERHVNHWSSQPRFAPLSEHTKYTRFPILDRIPTTFTKTDTNTDMESELFGKNDRLVKHDTQQKLHIRTPVSSPFQYPPLQISGFSSTIGIDLFHNHTRTQLRQHP
jgi:hypothetical protein